MTLYVPSLCRACVYALPNEPDTGRPAGTVAEYWAADEGMPGANRAAPTRCAAYPDGIPIDIALGADHRSARGDEVHGRTFIQADTPAAAAAFDQWRSVNA